MISTAAGIIFGPSLGRFSDRVGRRPILFFSMVCYMLYFILIFFARSIMFMFPITLLEGVGYIAVGAIAPAMVVDIIPSEERGWAMGTYNRIQNVGWLVGYGVSGYLADNIGFRPTFLVSAGLMTIGLLMTLLLRIEKRKGKQV